MRPQVREVMSLQKRPGRGLVDGTALAGAWLAGVAAAVVLGATPVGWGILAGGIIGGAVGGLAGSNVGAWGFGTAYKSVTTSFK